ncbi:MarR family EPS-associated transcriptional regulator [Ahniella affigens]|nr:MarR family EPS-associated transcriptional regulator [Ahniella affigens]
MARRAPKGGSVPRRQSGNLTSPAEQLRDAELQVLRLIEQEPALRQRDIAERLQLSLGKANYCIRALIELGWLAVQPIRNAANKLSYRYLLTAAGRNQRARAASVFLERKRREFQTLSAEIAELEHELARLTKEHP